ncbi:ubiquinol--cytochrome-c reductase subunit 2 [Saccharomycopsis crataegensis]|uniref:Cytochrome b-c1 complex subunit 2, mitochondrial n=1 Tax=Saccharomycopsis crataegensis TaxID=43959 RepID=A0AAV5QKC1_9ASCO|nr:ubiquinol--cytochrome-c reductase subunit 2 [Saccharomycopsis crataegensis]
MFSRSYSTAAKGLKVSAKQTEGHLSNLIVKINAGSRYAEKDGVAHLLSRFNFQNNTHKSALRFAREAELLGGVYGSKVSRDAITLSANFQKEDLPYFVNSLADVITSTQFKIHELSEVVLPTAKHEVAVASADPEYQAVEALHALAFRNGLGKPLLYDGVSKATLDDIKAYASKAYTASNIEIYGSGVDESALVKFIGESSFESLAEGSALTDAVKTQEGESRIRSANGNAAAIGAPIAPAEIGLYETIATFLNETTNVKAAVHKYSDAGLFTVVAADACPVAVSATIKSVVSTLKSGINASEFSALTKTKLAIESESSPYTAEPTVSSVGEFSLGKFSYVAIGNVSALPYADEL